MYCAAVAAFFTAVKTVNFRLHTMFDLGEIVEKRQASLTADPPRAEDGDDGSAAHDGNQHRYGALWGEAGVPGGQTLHWRRETRTPLHVESYGVLRPGAWSVATNISGSIPPPPPPAGTVPLEWR